MGEAEKCEKSQLYLESFAIVQAGDDGGLDWRGSNRPVRSGRIQNILKIKLKENWGGGFKKKKKKG